MLYGNNYIVGNGALSLLCSEINKHAPKGSEVLYIGGEKHAVVASEITRSYRIYRADGEICNTYAYAMSIKAHEDTRAVVAVGGGTAADIGKFVATRFSLPLITVMTSPSSVGFFVPSAMLENGSGFTEVYKSAKPSCVICDGELLDSGESTLAAGFGDICSRLVSLFDAKTAAWLIGESIEKDIETALHGCVGELLEINERGELTALRLAELCLKTGEVISGVGSSRLYGGGEVQLAHGLRLLRKKTGGERKSWGENALILGTLAIRIYLAFLYSGASHPHAVPDYNARVDGMSKAFSLPIGLCCERTAAYGLDADRLAYCVGEYRRELIGTAEKYEKTLSFAVSRFKRLYKDCGYSYNKYMTASDLRLCVKYAAELREKPTLFTVMRALGLFG